MPWYNFKAPSLPLPPFDYDQRREDQFANALRIYFNQLDSSNYALSANTGGGLLGFPHISARSETDQSATAANTPTLITWDTTISTNGFTLAPAGYAVAEVSGVYAINYSVQIANTANGYHDFVMWLRVNGADVVETARTFTLIPRKSAGNPSYLAGYSSISFELNAGDEIELYWATDQAYVSGVSDGIYLEAQTAQTSPYARPSIPSASGAITFVSALTA